MDQLKLYINNPVIQQLLFVVLGVVIILVIARLVKSIIPKYISDNNRKYRMRKFVTYLTYMIVVILILVIYSNKLTGLTVFLGVAGAGIAFALQEVIASIAGFIAINFSNFYNVGDRVMLGGIKGDVIDIGVLRTSIMQIGDWVSGDLYNGKIVSISNSFIFKEPVFNYSGDFPFLWDEVNIPIKTNGDYKYAEEVFQNLLDEVQGDYAKSATVKWAKMTEKYQLENARVMPMVTMSFDENWINFNLRFVVDYKKRRGTKDIISKKALDAIRNSDGRIEVASAAMNITLLK